MLYDSLVCVFKWDPLPRVRLFLKGTSQSMRRAVQNLFSFISLHGDAIHYATYVYTLRSSGVRAKYSLSMSPSMRFLITTGLGRNRALSCWVTWWEITRNQKYGVSNAARRQVMQDVLMSPWKHRWKTHAHLCHQNIVLHLLSRFHDAYDSSLDFMLPVIVYFLSRLLSLWVWLALFCSNCK